MRALSRGFFQPRYMDRAGCAGKTAIGSGAATRDGEMGAGICRHNPGKRRAAVVIAAIENQFVASFLRLICTPVRDQEPWQRGKASNGLLISKQTET
jgi:hypothetical protein